MTANALAPSALSVLAVLGLVPVPPVFWPQFCVNPLASQFRVPPLPEPLLPLLPLPPLEPEPVPALPPPGTWPGGDAPPPGMAWTPDEEVAPPDDVPSPLFMSVPVARKLFRIVGFLLSTTVL